MNELELRVQELEKKVRDLESVRNVSFIENIKRNASKTIKLIDLPPIKLSDLSDVSGTDSATTGQVLKKTATTWQPGTDNIA